MANRNRMQTENRAAIAVLNTLTSRDRVGIVYFDSYSYAYSDYL